MTILEAELTWTGERFERGLQVHVRDGRIAAVTRAASAPDARLDGRALLPGFVNAHSHAFLRGLFDGAPPPGGPERRAAWLALVAGVGPGGFRASSLRAFQEMRAAGVTTVGEFHYLHHVTGRPDYGFDEIVLDAAREAGLRIVLLSAYHAGAGAGAGGALDTGRQRFRSESTAAYWKQMDALLRLCEGEMRWPGAAVHSVCAASVEELAAVYSESRRRGIVFHLQLGGKAGEIEACLQAHGARPLDVVLRHLDVGESFTVIESGDSDPESLRRFQACGGQICLCPVTEAARGHGLPGAGFTGAGLTGASLAAGVALGTGSSECVSMPEAMRRLEPSWRGGSRAAVARDLLRVATEGGARALGIPAGRIAPGCWADFAAVDLAAPTLAGWTEETLAESLVFDSAEETIAATCVAGVWSAP